MNEKVKHFIFDLIKYAVVSALSVFFGTSQTAQACCDILFSNPLTC